MATELNLLKAEAVQQIADDLAALTASDRAQTTADRVATGEDVAASELLVGEAEAARDETYIARDAALAGAEGLYTSTANGIAATDDVAVPSETFIVADSTGWTVYENDGGVAVYVSGPFEPISSLVGIGKNLHNPAGILAGRTVHTDGRLLTSSVTRVSGAVPVVPGEKYTISGVGPNTLRVGAFPTAAETVGLQGVLLGTIAAGVPERSATFTIPSGYPFLRFDVTRTATDDDSFDLSASVRRGEKKTEYPYQPQIKSELIEEAIEDWTLRKDILYAASENMFNPDDCNFIARYSTSLLEFTADELGIAASNYMRIEEGETYTVSAGEGGGVGGLWPAGDGGTLGAMQAGYFAEKGDNKAIANVTFTGSGVVRRFTVPEGLGARYMVLSVSKENDDIASTTLAGNVQVERGTVATAFKAYDATDKVIPEALPDYLSRDKIAEIDDAKSDAALALSTALSSTSSVAQQAAIVGPVTLADFNHVIQVGQSLGVGAAGQPALHTVGWDSNYLTFAGGPKSIPVAAGGDAADTASFVTLIEDNNSPDIGTNRGETGLWSAGHALAQAVVAETGSYGGKGKFIFTAPSEGGQSISNFVKSTDPESWWQTMFLPSIRAAKAIADAASATYAVPVIFWVQGEANLGSSGYAASLSQLFDDMAEAVRAETGQTFDPHFVSYITSYATLSNDPTTSTRGGTLGQAAVIRARSDVHLGPVVYALPHASDDIHLINEGYAMMGAVFGQAIADILARDLEPRRLAFRHAYAGQEKTSVEVVFDVTGGALILDGESIAQAENYGFACWMTRANQPLPPSK